MPRQDLVMLSAVTRDSLSDEIFARIQDLRRYADAGQLDSAAAMIAYNGEPVKDAKWARGVNLQDANEKAHVENVLDNVKKLFAQFPDMHREYYACFRDKDNPAGQKHLYQIKQSSGKKTRMVSWVFFPVGDKMMFGQLM